MSSPRPSHDPYGAQPGAAYFGAAPAVDYASWGQRVGGYFVDSLVVLPFYIVGLVFGRGTDEATGLPTFNAVYSIFALLAFAVSAYNRWYQAGKTGQSWGRKALGIKLISEQTGQPIGGGMAFVRDLAHILDSLACYIGWLFPIWDAKRQTFADKVMKTIVVR